MSRYLATLESHLTPALNQLLGRMIELANPQNLNLFVTGSTMRDVFAGMQARELDLVVEGSPARLFPGDTAGGALRLAQACDERYPRTGVKPKLTPASIHEHLRTRDFSANAIALSVTRASRGLLLDPTNGVADIANRELRTISAHTFENRPSRLLSLLRLKIRHGFRAAEKTQAQWEEAMAAKHYRQIRSGDLLSELRSVALEPHPLEVLQAWDQAGLLTELLPMVAKTELNTQGFTRLQKARQSLPFGIEFPVDEESLFFSVLVEHLTPKQRAAFIASSGTSPELATQWQKLGQKASKAGRELESSAVTRPSQVYAVLSRAGATATLLLASRETHRIVHDRLRNYFTRYLPAAVAIADQSQIARQLDARPKRPRAAPSDATLPTTGIAGTAKA